MLQGALAGLALGGVYAIIAVCMTLMAQLVRVINFAQAAIGMFAAYLAVWLTSQRMPVPLAIVIGLAAGVAISLVVGLVISRWLAEAPLSSRSAVTIAALLLLIALSYIVFGTKPQPFRALVSGTALTIGDVTISMVTVVMLALALVLALAAFLVLRFTMIGTKLRAISDRPTAAELLGIPVRGYSLALWAVTGLVVSFVVLLIAPTQTSDALTLSMLVVPSAAAALLGAFRRLDLALVGGLLLGMIQGATAQFPSLVLIRDWIPLILIVIFLLWNQRKEVWDAAR